MHCLLQMLNENIVRVIFIKVNSTYYPLSVKIPKTMNNYDILKNHCKKIFFSGSGDVWYEEGTIGDDKSWYYRLYSWSLFSMYMFMTILEIMAAMFGDFPEEEMRDSVSLAVSHAIVMLKIYFLYSNKNLLKTMNQNMVRICEAHEEPSLMAHKHRIVKITLRVYFGIVYGSTFCYVIEGIRKLFDGSHFVTVVTYYPSYEDDSFWANGFRIFNTIVLLMLMMTMIVSVDSLTITYLIMFKYKFITLRHYFKTCSQDFFKLNDVDPRLAADKLTDGIVEGIVMHNELLRMVKDFDQAFGTVMALQLFLSSGTAVSLLLQIALADQLTLVASLKMIFFVTALVFILGLLLCNAGEITYQASLLPNALFYCGWHACVWQPPRRSVRRLVLLACAQAQQPLVIKAFKMFELSYGTYLQVLKGTYSLFTLFYGQNQ
ncbi:putative odorant receptor 19b isoform X1 [Ostrinia furnacalis]|uniref:Odorant receptor n=1 Tax=Ostrinia furnacalis TaxID=93504 RepID=A0A0E3VLQ6_OSTFU|nr:putative odorant receptor 19b isoform X1 [Ostrinia furnacalis]BAR43482.1 putative olfactory receptor 40 [Ostrinia furnacalis]